MDDLGNKKNQIPNLDSDKVEKGIYPWLFLGMFLSIFSSILLGNDMHMSTLVKQCSLFYMLLSWLVPIAICLKRGVKIGTALYKDDEPLLIKILIISACVVCGHCLGFITLRLFLKF